MKHVKDCKIKGCSRKAVAHGWCGTHYARWRRWGDPMALKRQTPNQAPPRVCTIGSCEEPHYAKGFCQKHYTKLRRYGDACAPNKSAASGSLMAWIDRHKGYDDEACLIWPFKSHGRGYGLVTYNGKLTNASRVMCIVAHGPPPSPNMHAAHWCGNGKNGCVNPRHLRWATQSENHLDKRAHGTVVNGEKNHFTRLTAEEVRQIRAEPGSPKLVAEKFGISVCYVHKLRNRQAWAHLD